MEDDLAGEMQYFDGLDNLNMDEQDPLADGFDLGETLFSQLRQSHLIAPAPCTLRGALDLLLRSRRAIWR